MARIKNHPLIRRFLSLGLPKNDCAIFGSGPLYAYGIIKNPRDLDVIARGEAWQKVLKLGNPQKLPLGDKAIRLFDGKVEIMNVWIPGKLDIDKLIDTAEIVEDIRFVNLKIVLKWKKSMARPKDLKHIKMIEKYLRNQL